MLILESISSDKAKEHGLKYLGFGRWISPYSKKLYVSKDDSIVPYIRKADRIKSFNNVKSTLSDEEFNNIAERIRIGKIKYIEKINNEKNKLLLNENLSAPDFIYAYVPKKIYNMDSILYVIIETHEKYIEFKSYNDSDFYCWHVLEKKNNKSYKSYIKYLRIPEHMLGSKTIRDYMYNLVNFYNVAKVTDIFVHCGLEQGVLMWSRYGVDFVSAEQRKNYLISLKDKLKNEIIKKANENKEFNNVLKDIYSKIVNCKHLWEITFLTAKLSNSTLDYIKRRISIESFIKGNTIYIGELLMLNTSMYGVMNLYPDSASYKQYYDYMSFKKQKPKQMIKEAKDVVEAEEVNGLKLFPSPFHIINNKIGDNKIWKQDEYDKQYFLNNLEIINGL